ncbi:hypothetical protein JR316_0002699 [Psilocybe cubensis]|uniref:Uncharacterized protein n=2 Tax=Psilocybe cubensis TaxID=181762 RepID=A0A8H7Y5U1_PSICU|nr:hypothetical protein JR316_0002699 [Psilocybe cubensis]KAH9485784.1 hypothetical protein JR316_0002699 [Psilocybe cubensis]
MSPFPVDSTASAASSATSVSSDPTPKTDHRMMVAITVLAIAGAFLIGFVIMTTLRLKRRQASGEIAGPYQGALIHSDHPATHITPFGAAGHHPGGTAPKFKHKPGEDMRIAIRRPDGAWHFTDSRTPFTPAGVTELEVTPSPASSSTSLIAFNSRFPPTRSTMRSQPPLPQFKSNSSDSPVDYPAEIVQNPFEDQKPPK